MGGCILGSYLDAGNRRRRRKKIYRCGIPDWLVPFFTGAVVVVQTNDLSRLVCIPFQKGFGKDQLGLVVILHLAKPNGFSAVQI